MLDSNNVEFEDMNTKKLLDNQQNELLAGVKNSTHEGSCWTLHSTLRHHLAVLEITPCKGSSYF